jgi:hypothetical protein
MFSIIRTRIALAAAAVAIVATSFAPVATTLAAPLAPTHEQTMAAKPDVTVKITRQDPYDDDVLHWFTVKNIGNAPTGVVMVKAECAASWYGDTEITLAMAKVIPALKKGEETQMSFVCDTTWGAKVTVGTLNDANTSNNTDTFGFF